MSNHVLTLLHASDLHFGRFFLPARAEALVRSIEETRPDVLVLSGDFTQRAKVREYRDAQEFLGRLPSVPTLVTPGNHDVPLYRVWERAFHPLRNYRRYIREALDECVRLPGITAVTLNSTAPHRAITNGRLGPAQVDFAVREFENAPEGDVRLLVTHHHLGPAPDSVRDHPVPGAEEIVRRLEDAGVDLVLGGHIHRAHAQLSTDVVLGSSRGSSPRHPVVLVQSGTTTSRRGRAAERGKNSLNVVRIDSDEIQVVHHLHEGAAGFQPVRESLFSRAEPGAVR